jgi:hypothetical protein
MFFLHIPLILVSFLMYFRIILYTIMIIVILFVSIKFIVFKQSILSISFSKFVIMADISL